MTGIEPHYEVERIGDVTGKHNECWYYVLDPKHDKFAVAALYAYAEACKEDEPQLSQELTDLARYWGHLHG